MKTNSLCNGHGPDQKTVFVPRARTRARARARFAVFLGDLRSRISFCFIRQVGDGLSYLHIFVSIEAIPRDNHLEKKKVRKVECIFIFL